MRIANACTTLLPPAASHSVERGEAFRPSIPALPCPVRMAEADAAAVEVYQLCEEISQVMRRAPRKDTRPARGNSERPSVPRRKKAGAR
jgi:hypothetical protein